MADPTPVLIGCGHGTADPAGRRALAQLRLAIGAERAGVGVRAASVDVQQPRLDAVVAELARLGRRHVVVPLLLSTGYHVAVDINRAVATTELAVAARALGPHPWLVEVVQQRLAEAGVGDRDPVVLAAAGSSDPGAVADVAAMAAALAELRAAPVVAGYLSAAEPTVAQALSVLYGQVGPKVAVANYLLAPGVFCHRLTALAAAAQEADRAASGAASRTPVIVSAPLAPHPLLARIALQRYDEALATAH